MNRNGVQNPVIPDTAPSGFRRVSRPFLAASLSVLGLLISACGHYKSDFSCKGYPENPSCLPTTQVYERRHEQLTHMAPTDGSASSSSSSTPSSADRVAAIAGQTEHHLGQPNLTQPVVLQVWVAPWRDSKNNLHEAQIVYAMVQQSDWIYGRKPKGMEKAGKTIFAPQLSHSLFEQGSKPGLNGGMPMLSAPRSALPAASPMPPAAASSDPSAILRQLQQQMPSLPGAGAGPGVYSPPMGPGADPEAMQEKYERMQEQREKMFGQ